MIPVFKPHINKTEILPELEKIFDSGWIGLGPKVVEFERLFANYIGVKYAIAVNSCTAALHLANMAAGVNWCDEVIVPAMTFASTALSVLYCNAIPVFTDIEEDTLCIDPIDIEKKITKNTKAIIAVHFGGHSCDMDVIIDIAKKYNLKVIEDVAHGCGGLYRDRMLGSIGLLGCFSFHAVKNLATGDGGMITTNNEDLYEKLKRLRWVGIDKDTWSRSDKKYSWQYSINELGYKYHMNDITAVIGIAQLKLLEAHNYARCDIVKKYNTAFKNTIIKTPVEKLYAKSTNHNYVIKVPNRDELGEFLSAKGISTGVHYEPVNHFNIFTGCSADIPVTEKIYKELITLPLYPSLTEAEQEYIIKSVLEFYK